MVTNVVLSKPDKLRSSVEIDAIMAERGFPEMEKLWRIFKRTGFDPKELSNSTIMQTRARHMAPLFGLPRLLGAVLFGLSVLGGYYLSFSSPLLDSSRSGVLWALFFAASSGGLFFLFVYGLTLVQRYVAYPMKSIMAKDLAFMLSQTDFRRWFDHTEEARRVVSVLDSSGINSQWDNPAYRVCYVPSEGSYTSLKAKSGCTFVLSVLRDFIGQKDPKRRKFSPGRYTPYLKNGKASVTEFVREHQSRLEGCKAEQLSSSEALKLLEDIQRFVRQDSPGTRVLKERIATAKEGNFLSGNEIQAEVWERNPWVDITHQEEFYSSASLRGVKLMGRGPKGRLGPFGYLRSKAVSALDLRTRKGRLVRVRLSAAMVSDGSPHAVLFVDGVEGSNALRPKVVKQVIEDYAGACGFRFVVYNRYVHNQIPKRFVRFVEESGAPLRFLRLEYVHCEQREYLDAFGFPLEPLEYPYPRGGGIGLLVDLNGDDDPAIGSEPTAWQQAAQWFRLNILWLIIGYGVMFATLSTVQATPLLLVPLVLVTVLLLVGHLRYQRKSLRSQSEVD